MQHSVKSIGKMHQEMSEARKEKSLFKANDFFEFAKQNSEKYSIVKNGEDLLVSTWHSDQLIEDFKSTIK